MMGTFLSRAFLMVFGYAYPAYECFKTVEKNKPEIEQLLFWCQYWILVAVLTVGERIGDAFVSWLPMYDEAKLAFFIYLWHSKSKGTTYVYDSFFRPYVAKHETEIDRNMLVLKVKAGEIGGLYWQKAVSYSQTRFFEILQYASSQSSSEQHSDQQEHTICEASVTAQEQQLLVDSSTTLVEQQHDPAEPRSESTTVSGQSDVAATTSQSKQNHLDAVPTKLPVSSLDNCDAISPQQETVLKEPILLTRRKWKIFGNG